MVRGSGDLEMAYFIRQFSSMRRLLLLSLLFPAALWGAEDWHAPGYTFRRKLVLESAPSQAPACHVRFSHLGSLRADGADIRVFGDAGRPVPHELLRVGPGDQAEILFQLGSSGPGKAYYVYFGNPAAPPPAEWQANAGVVLEIRKRGNGECDSWTQCQALFKNSREVVGRTLRAKIFDGSNPLGESEDFVSYYRTFLRAPTSGHYVFCTNSDDASFLLVNGALVAQFPGWHGAFATDGQRRGRLELKAGVHKLEYYHVQGSGPTITVAGWQRPGDKAPQLIADNDFVPVAKAKSAVLQRADGKPSLDFYWEASDSISAGDRHLTRVAFVPQGVWRGEIAFDFGDGTQARAASAADRIAGRHLYLAPGTYTVTCTAPQDSSATPIKQRVVVEPVWTQPEEFNEQRWQDYRALIVARLKEGRSEPRDVANLLPLAATLEDGELISELSQRAWGLCDQFTPTQRLSVFYALGIRLQEKARDYQGAARAFQEALKGTGTKAQAARARLHFAGLLLHVLSRTDEAVALLDKAKAEELASETDRRLLAIYRADALAAAGRRDEAVAAYEALADVVPLTNRAYAVRRRARLMNVESYIRKGDIEAALEELANIEWETPRERMADETGLLRAECYLEQHDYLRAATLLDRLLKVNTASGRIPEMLYKQLQAFKNLRQSTEFDAVLTRLKKDYPYAAETAWATLLTDKPERKDRP